MEWFYAKEGQQAGPVSDSELDALVRTGALTPETLVWREGMAEWLPHSLARPPKADRPAVLGEMCCECNRTFPVGDLLRFETLYVCAECKPAFFQKLREGMSPTGIAAWRSGKFIVTRKNARLPRRCIRCNKPAHGDPMHRKISWNPPFSYAPFALLPLLFFFHERAFAILPVFLFVLALPCGLMTRNAEIDVHLCQHHLSQFGRDSLYLAVAWAIGVAGFIANIFLVGNAWITGSLLVLVIGMTAFWAVRTRFLTAKKITAEYLWLRGASRTYLAALPEWSGRD